MKAFCQHQTGRGGCQLADTMKPGYWRAINLTCSKINWSENVLYLPFAVSVYFHRNVQYRDICWEQKRKDKGKKKHNLCK